MKPITKILILGGGFGGLYTALELEQAFGKDPTVDITLVNRENYFLFTPMLHEVAASDLDITTIVNPIRKMLRRTTFFDGEVTSIDLAQKRVGVTHGIDASHPHELTYDHLVLALGSVTNFYAIPGLEARALTMRSLADAAYLRNRLIEHLEEADFECCAALREPLLTFVVAGGGFAGVETVAAINDFLRAALKFYPNLTEEMLRVVLVEFAPSILPELGPELGRYALEKLAERRVEFRLNTKVAGLSDRGVVAPGRRADLNLIELETLQLARPRLVHDLPAGGRRFVQAARGYRATLVAGVKVLENGRPTGARPGRLVRAGN